METGIKNTDKTNGQKDRLAPPLTGFSGEGLHPILSRQLRRADLARDAFSPELNEFIKLVNSAYFHFDHDRGLLERSMDITSQELLERNHQLRNVSEELHFFIDSVPGPIFCLIAEELRIIEWNRTMETITGISKQNAIGKSFFSVVRINRGEEALRDFFGSGKATLESLEITFFSESPGAIRVLVGATTHHGPDDAKKIWFVGQDITELSNYRENLEGMVAEKNRELIDALMKERELAELKMQFITMASHEFRTPLAVIQSGTDLLLHYHDKLTLDQRQENLRKLQKEVHGMKEMLDDVLHFGKGQSGKLEFRSESIDLVALCLEAVRNVSLIDHSNVEIKTVGECYPVTADAKLTRQILTNLLSNAIKYSPSAAVIVLELEYRGDAVAITVQDQGLGISAEDRERIFEPFFRGRNAGARYGSGLGLAITRMAVEMHSGTIAVKSIPGEGSTFTVVLPQKGKK